MGHNAPALLSLLGYERKASYQSAPDCVAAAEPPAGAASSLQERITYRRGRGSVRELNVGPFVLELMNSGYVKEVGAALGGLPGVVGVRCPVDVDGPLGVVV